MQCSLYDIFLFNLVEVHRLEVLWSVEMHAWLRKPLTEDIFSLLVN